MAGASKHKAGSGRKRTYIPFQMFVKNAQTKKIIKANRKKIKG